MPRFTTIDKLAASKGLQLREVYNHCVCPQSYQVWDGEFLIKSCELLREIHEWLLEYPKNQEANRGENVITDDML